MVHKDAGRRHGRVVEPKTGFVEQFLVGSSALETAFHSINVQFGPCGKPCGSASRDGEAG
jgi:hypothetical protein